MFKKIKKRISIKREKGFLVLIAVMVSMILLSIGMFIAMIAVREIKLSSSVKASQTAFFAADSVMECALFKEFKQGGFLNGKYTALDDNSALFCAGRKFAPEFDSAYHGEENICVNSKGKEISCSNPPDYVKHIYYVSLAPMTVGIDRTGNGNTGYITRDEIKQAINAAKYPYVKLIVKKPTSDLSKPVYIQTFGHNIAFGKGVIERAIEVTY